jgi:hypothetical protein
MKPIKMGMIHGERLKCDICGKWLENQYVLIYLDDDGDFSNLLCEECHEEQKKEASE